MTEPLTPEREASVDYYGCARNEVRSPFSTSRSKCAGKVRFYRRTVCGIEVSSWVCDAHEAMDAALEGGDR